MSEQRKWIFPALIIVAILILANSLLSPSQKDSTERESSEFSEETKNSNLITNETGETSTSGEDLLAPTPQSQDPAEQILKAHLSGTSQPSNEQKWQKCANKFSLESYRSEYIKENKNAFSVSFGDWFWSPETKLPDTDVSTAAKFFLGLAHAGLLEGVNNEMRDAIDYQKAIDLLKQVAAADEQNAAPLIYAAVIESRRGRENAANILISRAARKAKYDDYSTLVTRTIFSRVVTPLDYLAATGFYANTPVPNTLPILKLLKGKPESSAIGMLMMAEGLNKDSVINDLEWSMLDYSTGYALLDKDKRMTFSPPKELNYIKNRNNPNSPDNFFEKFSQNCDPKSLEPFVDYVRMKIRGSGV